MIFFKFRIDNPWFTPKAGFESKDGFGSKDYYWKDVKLSKNKNFEIQISRFERSHLLDVSIDLRWWGQDHQGPELDLNLLGYMFNVKIYDRRHWNWYENRWKTDAEAQAEIDEYNRACEQSLKKGA